MGPGLRASAPPGLTGDALNDSHRTSPNDRYRRSGPRLRDRVVPPLDGGGGGGEERLVLGGGLLGRGAGGGDDWRGGGLLCRGGGDASRRGGELLCFGAGVASRRGGGLDTGRLPGLASRSTGVRRGVVVAVGGR